MKYLKKVALATIFAVIAAGQAQAGTWIGPYVVNYVEYSNGNVYFQFDAQGSQTYDTGIACNNWAIMFPGTNAKDADRAYAMGLAAQASGRKVKFFLSGACNGYPVAIGIASDARW